MATTTRGALPIPKDLLVEHAPSWIFRGDESRRRRVATQVEVKTPTLVAICVLAGIGLGGLITLLALKKDPAEAADTPLLADKA